MECIFCRIVSGEVPAKKVYEDDDVMAFEDIRPQAPVHILVIPKRHIATVNDLTESDAQLMGKLVLVAKRIASERGVAERGYRLVLNCNRDSGQEVFHIHLHLLGGRRFTWPPG
ncbi:MAG: histidine triad nucleotide-binding protein [Planctomycetota bacterium]|nr:MAG: histidine triad nucleotide-binding protein [Planctomycetota bacterium]